METIKEKAKAYSLEAKENAVFGYDEEDLEKGFLAGANYVLECIEESIKNSPAGYGLIYYIIEQLKE